MPSKLSFRSGNPDEISSRPDDRSSRLSVNTELVLLLDRNADAALRSSSRSLTVNSELPMDLVDKRPSSDSQSALDDE